MRLLVQVYERLPLPLLSLSFFLSRVLSSHICPATLPTAGFSIAFTYELNYYMQLPMDCVAAVNLARCPLNNERMIRDKLSNGENDLNHAEHPPSSPPPCPLPPSCRVMDRSIFDVPYY